MQSPIALVIVARISATSSPTSQIPADGVIFLIFVDKSTQITFDRASLRKRTKESL